MLDCPAQHNMQQRNKTFPPGRTTMIDHTRTDTREHRCSSQPRTSKRQANVPEHTHTSPKSTSLRLACALESPLVAVTVCAVELPSVAGSLAIQVLLMPPGAAATTKLLLPSTAASVTLTFAPHSMASSAQCPHTTACEGDCCSTIWSPYDVANRKPVGAGGAGGAGRTQGGAAASHDRFVALIANSQQLSRPPGRAVQSPPPHCLHWVGQHTVWSALSNPVEQFASAAAATATCALASPRIANAATNAHRWTDIVEAVDYCYLIQLVGWLVGSENNQFCYSASKTVTKPRKLAAVGGEATHDMRSRLLSVKRRRQEGMRDDHHPAGGRHQRLHGPTYHNKTLLQNFNNCARHF